MMSLRDRIDPIKVMAALFAALFGALLIFMFIGEAGAFLPDKGPCSHGALTWVGEVGEEANLYTYVDGQNTCYMLVGQLHGKTVSISCVRGR